MLIGANNWRGPNVALVLPGQALKRLASEAPIRTSLDSRYESFAIQRDLYSPSGIILVALFPV
jgi:hypothetical protein